MLLIDTVQKWFDGFADVHGVGAPGMKSAALRRFDKIGDTAIDTDKVVFTSGEVGDGSQKPLGIRMRWILKDPFDGG